jgi:O-antigen ligase
MSVEILGSVEGASGAGEKAALIALAMLLAVAVLLAPTQAPARLKALTLLGVVAFTPVLLAIDVWNTSPMRHVRDHAALAAGAVVLALAVVAALAALFERRSWAFPLAVVFTLPFRVPITSGGSTANLLVPLYAVVAAGVIAHCVRLLRGDPPGAASEIALPRLASPRTLEWLLMASVVLYAIQAPYSDAFSKALQNTLFFYVPFALMLALLREVRFTRELLLRCVALTVALACLFVAIGLAEYARKSLLLNSSLVASNVYGNYFRVNSVFYDPNIYGRYLALAMLLLACIALWTTRRRAVLISAAALVWLWVGLLTSISQTSMVALLVGLAVLGGWRFGVRRAAYAAIALAAVGLIVLFAAPSSLHFGLKGKGGSVNNATSGRANLVRGGIDLFADRPLAGFGSGSFADQYQAHQAGSVASSTSASHTIPITVAAEQGILGLILYLALVLCCFGVLFRRVGRSPPRIALAACFTALLVHTMAYADFLEDPITWALLGIGMALAVLAAGHDRETPAAGEQAHMDVLDHLGRPPLSCSTT